MAKAAMRADGQSLQQSLPPETWRKLEDYGKARGLPVTGLQGFEAWFVTLMISMVEMQRLGLDPELGLDRHFATLAAKAGKATLYRRWPSKAELVVDAVGCMKQVDPDVTKLPDTGTLRGDLVAMIKAPTIEDAERKMRLMSGLMSMLSTSPELAGSVRAVLVEPRAALNRFLLQRALARGAIRDPVGCCLPVTRFIACVVGRIALS
jgi:hypothetical protein